MFRSRLLMSCFVLIIFRSKNLPWVVLRSIDNLPFRERDRDEIKRERDREEDADRSETKRRRKWDQPGQDVQSSLSDLIKNLSNRAKEEETNPVKEEPNSDAPAQEFGPVPPEHLMKVEY